MALTTQRLDALNEILEHQWALLRNELLARLRHSGDARLKDLVGRQRELGYKSLAGIAAELQPDRRNQLVDDVQAVEDALGRMARSEYGYCTNCGTEIPFERLRTDPATELCFVCRSEHSRFAIDATTV